MDRTGRNRGSLPTAAGAAALALALAHAPLGAQSVSDYRLPGSESPRPNVQGPVDPDNPVVARPTARPTASPSAAPVATTPTPQPSPATTASPLPRTSRPAPQGGSAPAAPRPTATDAGPTASQTTTPALPPLGAALPTPAAADGLLPTPVPNIAPAPAQAAGDSATIWPWLAGAAALLAALLAGLWWWRRRPQREPEIAFEPPVVTRRPSEPEPRPTPAATPTPELLADVVLPASGLGIALQARRMNASLMATTLSYSLTLTNNSPEPLTALAIEGEMIAAHASLPPERQIASSAQRLELRHSLVTLAPGESAEFSGDFRLPLTAITPIRSGNAAYFVPLARLRVVASTSAGTPLVEAQTFVVGELPEQPGAALRPFRLDLGPRNYARIGQRAVS